MVSVRFPRFLSLLLLLGVTAGCGGSSSSTPSPSAPSPTPSGSTSTTITIPTNARTLGTAAYLPNPATVAQGAVVTWSNTDSTAHDIVSDSGAFDSGRMAPNDNFKFTFASKGTFPYHCSIHPGMTGTIVVQ
jgi:plastocyanin